MNLFTIPPGAAFLDAIAAEWLSGGEDPLRVAQGLILLPTRRAARALADSFLHVSGGRPLLLPRITALGALDEAPLDIFQSHAVGKDGMMNDAQAPVKHQIRLRNVGEIGNGSVTAYA